MKHRIFTLSTIVLVTFSSFICAEEISDLQEGFLNPPRQEGVRCWWWWLNSNVTKEAITRDLTQMKAKGFSGAMIFDAGGAEQRGNAQVPEGPLFAGPQWRELYKHALKEGERLGLELGLSIQSGWNLGGPNVTPDFAAKQITFSQIKITGPVLYDKELTAPKNRDGFYRDICVLAYPEKENDTGGVECEIKASSSQNGFPVKNVTDSQPDSFWVSSNTTPGKGPTKDTPEWLEFSFKESVKLSALRILGRKGYGPRNCAISIISDSGARMIGAYPMKDGELNTVQLAAVSGKKFRISFDDAYDPRYPNQPRNVQVAEISLLDEKGNAISPPRSRPPIENLNLKSMYRELGGSAPDCRFLLNDRPALANEEDTRLEDILNITDKMSPDGVLTWQVPEGEWTVLRFGYTITNAHVSTYSGQWKGLVIDYLSRDAFERYWNEVVAPLIEDAGPLAGTTLKQLETDSWECGGMNWTPNFPAEFKARRLYDPLPYLPVIAGKIVENRDVTNCFLADFRKTIGDCVTENHYQVFAELAHKHNLEIQPESGGPHAGPMDAIRNLGRNDIVMSEFWAPSPHRPQPVNRFFVKQASSVAHIYGKKYVGAESFTTIGPHWNDVLWKSQKPSSDHEFCSGLNMVFFHTFTCSPKEMGLPGQEYFAGTHVNPQVTWWEYSDAFIDYLNRCQYILQQGKFIADVLYYYGDHVPNLVQLKEADPAKVLPGYDYDVTNEEILLQLKVDDNRIEVPGGVRYRLLVLPDHKVLSLAALEKVQKLLQQGATILGPKPQRLVSLVGGAKSQERFKEISNQLWGPEPDPAGHKQIGKGRLIWGKTAREVLQEDGVEPDFAVNDADFDYIHYTIGDVDVYYVCNQSEQQRYAACSFRVSNKDTQLWDPITGLIYKTQIEQEGRITEVPIHFTTYGSWFVVFSKDFETDRQKYQPVFTDQKKVQAITGPWQVTFEPKWGGPESIQFQELTDWTKRPEPGIKFYSGKAVYTKDFYLDASLQNDIQYWLDLGSVEDVGIARARLNGRDLGILWTKPFRVEITGSLKSGQNHLEIDVINSWRNRLVGDRGLPEDTRFTKTNITIRREWNTLSSGLLGPVHILSD